MTTNKLDSSVRRRPWSTVWNITWKAGRCLIIAYFSIVVLMLLFESRLVYPLELWDPQVRFGQGASLKEVYFNAGDGTRLHGLYRQRNRPRVVILYLHGNGGNIGHRAGTLRLLMSRTTGGRRNRCNCLQHRRECSRCERPPIRSGIQADDAGGRQLRFAFGFDHHAAIP